MRYDQYKGKLDFKLAAEGIKLAYENAVSLIEDAELLLTNNRYARCVALSILAIEEAGKSTIIRSLLLSDNQERLKREWKNYRKHTEKNLAWILPELVQSGARTLGDLKQIFDPSSDHGQVLDTLKQLSIYTDIFSSKRWTSPQSTIDEELAKGIFFSAQAMVNIDRVMASEKELELWVKHMKPARDLGRDKMKEALKNCYIEAASLGLIDEKKVPELIKFLL